jgi:two-component sensor histidine kinase
LPVSIQDNDVAFVAAPRTAGRSRTPRSSPGNDSAHRRRLELLTETAAGLLKGQDPEREVLPTLYGRLPAALDRDDELLVTAAHLLCALAADRAAQQRSLAESNRELRHRVKNMLAMVQAIATISARTAPDLDGFTQSFNERVEALAKTQDLLSEGQTQGADLRQLLNAELEPFEEEGHLAIDGPDVVIPAALAVPLGMAIHELTTNAVKYGALSTGGGQLSVRWSEAGTGPGRRLVIDWIEHGGLPVAPPSRRGFGSKLLDRLPGRKIKVARTFDPDGLKARIEVALAAP